VAIRIAPFVVGLAICLAAAGCTSSKSNDSSGPPSCSDTSADAGRLARGCVLHGNTYRSIVMKCFDGRTLYNVPAVPPDGVSGFAGGKLRTHAVTPAEVTTCQSGATPSS
jgi:hypothetical protein